MNSDSITVLNGPVETKPTVLSVKTIFTDVE